MKQLVFFISLCLFNGTVRAQSLKTDSNAILLEYYQNQRFNEALIYLKDHNPEPVTNLKVLGQLAYSSQMAGKYPEATDYYLRIYQADTTNATVLYNLGSINVQRGDSHKALYYYQKILHADSTNYKVYNQLASLSQAAGDLPAALKYFKKANRLNPISPDVAYDLGNLYLNTNAYNAADSVCSIALQADTANLLLLFVKAQALYHLFKTPETIIACKQLLSAGDKNQVIVDMLGTSYYLLKQYNRAIETFESLETDNTAGETSYYYIAMSYKALNQQIMAITYFDKAIKAALSPNISSYYSEIADSYEDMHRFKKAVQKYNKSLLYGTLVLAYYSLANIYDTSLKEKSAAVHYYKLYLKSNPPEKQKKYITYARKRLSALQH